METSAQTRRAIQAVGAVIQAGGKEASSVLKVMKMLWAADRFSLRTTGSPLGHSTYVAMENGPVPSHAYHLVTQYGSTPFQDRATWAESFERRGNTLVQIADTGEQALSPADRRMIEKAVSAFGHMSASELAWDVSHVYPEWARFESELLSGGVKSRPMDFRDFFKDPEFDPYFQVDTELLEAARQRFEYRSGVAAVLEN